jgi:hypothetical protein
MIVNRRTFVAKRGHLQEAVALLKQEADKMGMGDSGRIYVPEIAPFDFIATEMEFKDWDAYHKFWGEWSPGEAFWTRWYALTENGGTNEVWRLVE